MTVPGIEDMTDTTVEASPVEAAEPTAPDETVHQRDDGAVAPLLDRAR